MKAYWIIRLHPDGQGAHAVRRVHRRMRVQG